MHRLNPIDAKLLESAIHHAKKKMSKADFVEIVNAEWDTPHSDKPLTKGAHAITAHDKKGGPD